MKNAIDLKRIPLSTVGRYCLLIESQEEYDAAAEAAFRENFIDTLYIVGDVNISEKKGINASRISKAQAKDISAPFLPPWIEDEKTFNLALEGKIDEITPLSAEIFPSLRCCFRCSQCAYREAKTEVGIWNGNDRATENALMMSMDDMRCAVEALAEAGVKETVFTGGGEPLINYEVTAYGMEQACERGIKTGLFTNGYLLTEDKSDRLLAAGADFIRISIYGFERESFSKYTSADVTCYDKVINNLKNLLARRRALASNTKILLSVLMQPVMIPDVTKWEQFIGMFTTEELQGIDGVRITPAINYADRDDQHSNEYFMEFINYMDAYAETHSYPKIVIFRHRLRDMYDSKAYSGCSGSRLFAELGPGGKAYYCCEKACNDRYIIGNYKKDSLCKMCKSSCVPRETLDNSNCPYLCKPHEFNRFLYLMQEYIQTGRRAEIIQWAEDLKRINGSIRVS